MNLHIPAAAVQTNAPKPASVPTPEQHPARRYLPRRLAGFLSWLREFAAAVKDFVTDYEASEIEPEEVRQIVAEYEQQRALALAGDIEAIHEGMPR